MSHLQITTRTGAAINPLFSKMFIAIADDDADAPISITHIDPFIECETDEQSLEAIDIQNMAVFLIMSNEMVGVKWGGKYYFGDVDLMDNESGYLDDDGVTVLQYCIED
jgi:hypothetical protein